jgi:hypothetical protein
MNYIGDYIRINGLNVHYKTLEIYIKHIHSHQDIGKDPDMGWDLVRSNLHDYVFDSIEGDITDEWRKQFDEFIERLFICNICKEVPPYFDWYCKKCDGFVSIGDVMRRLEKYSIENSVM